MEQNIDHIFDKCFEEAAAFHDRHKDVRGIASLSRIAFQELLLHELAKRRGV